MIRKSCTTLDVKIASLLSLRICLGLSTGHSTRPDEYSCSRESIFFRQLKTAFIRGRLGLCFDVSFCGVRYERCEMCMLMYLLLHILYSTLFIYLITYNDITVVNVITADCLDRLDRTCMWRFNDVECNVLCIIDVIDVLTQYDALSPVLDASRVP